MSTPMRPMVSTSSAGHPPSPFDVRARIAVLSSARRDRGVTLTARQVYSRQHCTSILCHSTVRERGVDGHGQLGRISARGRRWTGPARSRCTSRWPTRLQELIENGELPVGQPAARTRWSWPNGSACRGPPSAARSSTWSSAACWCASAASAPRSCTPRCAGRWSCPACTTTWRSPARSRAPRSAASRSGRRPTTSPRRSACRRAPRSPGSSGSGTPAASRWR